MERMVLLYEKEIKELLSHLSDLEEIGKEEELKEYKIQILQATTQIRTILGAGHWTLDKHVQLKK